MTVCNSNFLQPNGFKLSINRNNYPNLEFLIQSVDHPSVNSTPADQPYSRIGSVSLPGDKLEFGEISFGIILDEDLNGYSEIYNWMKRNIENEVVNPTDTFHTDQISHYADITLTILTSKNNKSAQFIYRDAFPISIGNISLEANADISPIIIPVSFRFTYFEIK